jgi:acyl-CoA reductase-like NAD-dependent aldehyde dehydrogenase
MTALTELKNLSGKLFLGGEYRDSAASDGLDVIDPATEDVIGRIPNTLGTEVDEAIAIANKVQKGWKKVNALTRAELLHEVASNMRQSRGYAGFGMTMTSSVL